MRTNLNKNFTFDNFIVNGNNQFAKTVALSVAEQPGTSHNPLFIYGNSKSGKTHLMYAIGNYIKENSKKKILYVNASTFLKDFSKNYKNNDSNSDTINTFKKKYRTVDILLIDNIQCLATNTKAQQEFFHTFNTLYGDNKQIVISSDKSPEELELFDDRLKNRFNWGLTIELLPAKSEIK